MQVSIRELKANPARAIALAHNGGRVQITSYRKVVADLVTPRMTREPKALTKITSDNDAMARLLASGLVIQPATQAFKLPMPIIFPPSPDGKTMMDFLDESRGPR